MKLRLKIKDEYELINVTPKILEAHSIKIGNGTKIMDDIQIGDNTIIGENVIIKGNTEIGENCEIGHFTIINNSVIGRNVKIGHHNMIEGSVIKDGSMLDNSFLMKGEFKGKIKFNKNLDNGIFINQGKLNITYTGGQDITINCETYKIKDIVKDVEKFARSKGFSVTEAKKAMKYLKLIQEYDNK